MDLVGVGLNATDTLVQVGQFPERGSKSEFDGLLVLPGGQVATTVIACATWGAQCRYVGKLGDDSAAELHESAFAAAGVEAQLIRVPDAASPQSLILVDAMGERTVMCRRDPLLRLQPEELRREWINGARVLHLDGHDTEAAIQAARWAREEGVQVVADLDEIYDGVDDLLRLVDYLIVSRNFPEQATGEKDLGKALQLLKSCYGARVTAATLGEEGVVAWDGATFHTARAFQVPVVDTTGAGDVFHAGFIHGLLAGWSLDRQLEFASAAAALNCLATGARGISSVGEIQELMETGTRRSGVEFVR